MNIIYVSLDTLRADHVSCYGYGRDTTPTMDGLAVEGVLFERAYPSDIPTQPSYTALLSGRRGLKTGVVSHHVDEQLEDSVPVFPEVLARAGYRTGAVSTLYHMKKYFARGFDSYLNPVAGERGLVQRVTAEQINQWAIPWLRANREQRFFLFVHYWDPHTVYLPPPEYRSLYYSGNPSDPENRSLARVQDLMIYPFIKRLLNAIGENITDFEYVIAQYDAEIRYTDDKLGELLRAVEDLGLRDDTAIIVSSDHGESMGEHDVYFDHASVHEHTARVPLIICHPEIAGGKRVEALVQQFDVVPTIFEWLEVEPPEGLQGNSLNPLLRGETTDHYDAVFTNQGLWQATRMIRTRQWKLIRTIDPGLWAHRPCTELYDLERDPKEERNVAEERPEMVDQLELRLDRWVEEELGSRPDPLRVVAAKGLPPKAWLARLIEQDRGTYDEWRRRMGW